MYINIIDSRMYVNIFRVGYVFRIDFDETCLILCRFFTFYKQISIGMADRAKRVRDCSFGITVGFLVSESHTVLPNKNILANRPRFPYKWKTKVIKVC